jgi:hypothetical protein
MVSSKAVDTLKEEKLPHLKNKNISSISLGAV